MWRPRDIIGGIEEFAAQIVVVRSVEWVVVGRGGGRGWGGIAGDECDGDGWAHGRDGVECDEILAHVEHWRNDVEKREVA